MNNRANRTVAATGAATLIATLGLTAWIGAARADACPGWTDPKGDSSTGQRGLPETGDTQMDILSAGAGTVGDSFVARITTDGLSNSSSDAGDEFALEFTVAGQEMVAYADRVQPFGEGLTDAAGFVNLTNDDAPLGAATAVYDLKTKTVTITGKLTELAKAVAKPVLGQSVTAISAVTSNQVFGLPVFIYDAAPTKLTTTIGAACEFGGAAPAPAPSGSATATGAPSGSAAPSASGSPTPSASASAAPSGSPTPAPSGPPVAGAADLPRAGCFTFTDVKGDAVITAVTGGPSTPNDPDLDIVGLTMQSTPETTKAFIKVDKLATRPSMAPGHTFFAYFTVNKKVVQLVTTSYDPAAFGTVVDALAAGTAAAPAPAPRQPQTRMLVDATYVPSKITSKFDVASSTVTITIPTADLTTATAGAFVPGVELTAVSARDTLQTPAIGLFVDSTAKDNAAASTPMEKWTVGDNACFSTPTTLTSVGAVTAQFGDVAKVAVKLVDGAGAPVAGQQVALSVPGTTATVTTGADGIARLAATMRGAAGTGSLTATFAGAGAFDTSTMTVPFTTTVEKTVLSAKGLTGAVTATLLDDDRKAVAGQTVTFTQGSVKRTAKTDAKGVAKAGGFKPGQAVTVSFAGLAGKYTAASTSTKA